MASKTVLVVGAGFSGATIARTLADAGVSVEVIDRRSHIAGNAYDELNEFGLRVHHYGPHIFHTSNKVVVDFLSRFTTWVPYKHRVKGMLSSGELVTLPVNLDTIEKVGEQNVVDIFYRPYTRKMWGVDIEELAPDVLRRVPIRRDFNDLYFPNDSFQALPKFGYGVLIGNMLDHPKIQVHLEVAYENRIASKFFHVFNSMSIDEFFDYELGVLPYRSLRFHTHTIPVPQLFPVATVNFTHNEKYTRVTEWKNFPNHGENPAFTTVTIEEPCDFLHNGFERFYPVKDVSGENRKLYLSYKKRVPEGHTFIGRCGLYAYIDMHQAVSSALSTAHEFLKSFN